MLERPLTRRAWLGGAALTALGIAGLKPGAPEAASVSCILTPEQTEGPYYIAGEKLRRNITDGRPGAPMQLRAFVVDATTCRPIKNAAVDIWHADAGGVYSGFGAGASNRTFMRGIQRTNAKGLALFRTVYPGWYQGRTVHIHVKVHVGGNVVHADRRRLPPRAVQLSTEPQHAKRERRNLPQRRQQVAPEREEEQRRPLRRDDHDGRSPFLATRFGTWN